jgi:hypothetical protein
MANDAAEVATTSTRDASSATSSDALSCSRRANYRLLQDQRLISFPFNNTLTSLREGQLIQMYHIGVTKYDIEISPEEILAKMQSVCR